MHVHIKICTKIFRRSLYLTAQNCKEFKCIYSGECVIYYSTYIQWSKTLKRNKLLIDAIISMNLKSIMVIEKYRIQDYILWFGTTIFNI